MPQNDVFNVELQEGQESITLQTAGTYVDKNIVFNITSNIEVLTSGEIETILDEILSDLSVENSDD